MDFFRRVFNKSGSNPDLTPLEGSNDSSLFGGLDVNELDQSEDVSAVSDPTQSPEGEKSGFTSEFSFIGAKQHPPSPQKHSETSSTDSTVSVPSQESTPIDSTEKLPLNTTSSPQTGSPKATAKKTSKKKSEASSSSPTGSPSTSTPKKRVKKRTLENRPGYAVSEPDTTPQSDENTPTSKTLTSVLEPRSEDVSSISTTHSPSLESDSRMDTSPEPVTRLAEHDSQNTKFQSLQLDLDATVASHQSSLRALSDRIRISYTEKSAIYEKLGTLERSQIDLRSKVKEAELEEHFEKAADLNAQIDVNQVSIDQIHANLQHIDSGLRQLEAEKIEILKSFLTSQIRYVHQLSGIKSAQLDVIIAIEKAVRELENETTTVYASKIEMLEERLADVESELARILEREQKVEAKITAGAQGLVETLNEDSEKCEQLEIEISELRATLQAKEALLATVQARVKSNQAKVDSLRKEQGEYLEDILSDKKKKIDLLSSLRLEKSQMDAQLLSQHDKIDSQQQKKLLEVEIGNSVDLALNDGEKMIDSSKLSIDAFSKPLIILDNDHSSQEGDNQASEKQTLDELRTQLSTQRRQLESTTELIATKNTLLANTRSEIETSRASLPLLEQSKQAAVATRDYKEAARLKAEIATTTTLMDTKAQNVEDLSTDIQKLQSELILQQNSITALQESIHSVEERTASVQMAELAKRREQIQHALVALRSPSSSNFASLLHEDAILVSIAQLEGLDQATKGEQAYLAQKFDLAIPELSEPQVTPDAMPEVQQATESVAEETETNEPNSTASNVIETDAEAQGTDEEGGLFDGLEESDMAVATEHETQKVTENQEMNIEEPSDAQSTVDEAEKAKIELEKHLSELEAKILQAEQEEDYEKAAELLEQLGAVKARLDHT